MSDTNGTGRTDREEQIRRNLGTRRVPPLRPANFPDAGAVVQTLTSSIRPPGSVDVLLVNPPTPDGGIWIRSQHRVGRRSRENMIWPQVCLAQLASLLAPDYTVEIVDCVAMRMGWPEFEKLLDEKRPKYYLTQVTAPTLRNDMYGVFLAKSVGAKTMAFGTHVTPMTLETMRPFPALDFVLRGEPEATLRELLDTFEGKQPSDPRVAKIVADTRLGLAAEGAGKRREPRERREGARDPQPSAEPIPLTVSHLPLTVNHFTTPFAASTLERVPAEVLERAAQSPLAHIPGLAWRLGDEIIINRDRPFFPDLDDLPIPLHHLLPLDKQRMPMIKGPFTFIVTSRGCPAGCKYCIKHVSYQNSVRLRSPEKIFEELQVLADLGVHNVHMYADLFTVNRDQVVGLCDLILRHNFKVRWTCNSRVDYVDEEMLQLMGRAGCYLISWGIESANEEILKRAHKGYRKQQAYDALRWAKAAGIKNWGYFIIGLPGETVETIQETIAYSKSLPLDIALFHIAAPYPGTPFFFEVVENGWFRPGTKWEEVDMDQSTVLDYHEAGLTAEQLEYWQKRATREWSFRPGPMLTFLKGMNTWEGFKSAVSVGVQTLKFVWS
ncbi:MAG: radical SAM protein [Caldilineales bacterium]|nr:radical SAM protein [Caldilineales bacterium]MDW8317180.1 radical SAM protein [Anaerolineae bacterium]